MTDDEAPPTGPDLTRGVPASALLEGVPLLGHADDEPVLLARCGGEARAVGARCPHYGAPLADGLLVDGTIRCPWHHAAFDLATGAVVRPPALEGLPCWRVEEHDGRVVVRERRDDGRAPGRPRAAGRATGRPPESVVVIGGGAAGIAAVATVGRDRASLQAEAAMERALATRVAEGVA